MSVGLSTEIDAAGDRIVTDIKTKSNFGNRVYKQYSKSSTEYPYVILYPESDVVDAVGFESSVHHVTFLVNIVNRGEGTESDLDNMNTYVGDVYDALAADRALNGNSRNLEIRNIDFAYDTVETYILHTATITVEVEIHRVSGE